MMPSAPSAFTLGGMNDAQRTEFWAALALRHTGGLGSRTWKKLLNVYPSPYAAVLDAQNWTGRAGISKRIVTEFRSERWREEARKEWNAAGSGGWRVLLWTDARFPLRLKEICDPPLFLYYVGDASLLSNPGVGVVGSRLCSRDGITTTRELCRRLSASGVTTVSGLARGIDSEAHKAALESWGSTIAVLGTGPDVVYPPENAALHAALCEKGLVLTEFAPGTVPEAKNFPLRNRIISGLSLGVLVVEAAKRSGSLITARHALDQGREVFAVPGRIQARTSTGCHDLIRQGAKAVFCCDDVLVEIAPLIGINAHEWKTPEEVSHPSALPRRGVMKGPHVADEDTVGADARRTAEHERVSAGARGNKGTKQDGEAEYAPPAEYGSSFSEEHTVPSGGTRHSGIPAVDTDAMTPDERAAYDCLAQQESMHIDILCRALEWPPQRMSSVLLMLEVQGAVRQLPGMHYSAIV